MELGGRAWRKNRGEEWIVWLGQERGESLSVARAPHIMFVLCELKWHHALRHFIEHLLCIGRENKLAHTSHLLRGKNRGEGGQGWGYI